ncbi:MAG TPA: amidohydrolase family protein, partial [Gemmatimonadaceae bacterium]|nr:amidohydrolase family protein [Gemmatimonadaceae bacterium]
MSRPISRKEFLTRSALVAGGAALPRTALGTLAPVPTAAEAPQAKGSALEADRIVVNARVLTSDPAMPRAQAFAVKDGKFLAVGRNDDVRNLATARTQVLDAAGMTVTPGFIDCHCHPSGVNELFDVNGNLRSIAELKAAIAKKASETPPGFWV